MEKVAGSFRDPCGYVFQLDGTIYRRVSTDYTPTLKKLVSSGLYRELLDEQLLLPFDWVDDNTIRPEQLAFVSYPYEWCFAMYKDAALATLRIAQIAIEHGMLLKDANAYNIQYHKGKMQLIDTLSFEEYKDGTPWPAYRQFCQQFLAPLALMAYRDVRLGQILRPFMDGVPLDLASSLLPRVCVSLGVRLHIHGHAALRNSKGRRNMSINSLILKGLLRSLESTIRGLTCRQNRDWADYGTTTSYSREAADSKRAIVSSFLRKSAGVVWDFGANNGEYSGLAQDVICFDSSHACVENIYKRLNVLSLIMDFTNPSPGIGFAGDERMSLEQRGKADTIMALALIHHLAIGNNTPLEHIAEWLKRLCRKLIIEFVPKNDEQVEKLLLYRPDIFGNYTVDYFEQAFSRHFTLVERRPVADSYRALYLMEAR